MDYTWAKFNGYLEAVQRQRRRSYEELLNVVLTGTRGSSESVQDFFNRDD